MNTSVRGFVNYVLRDAPQHNKALVSDSVVKHFSLVKDGAMFRNEYFAVRFCYSSRSSASFSNTVLSLAKLKKIDRIPFFVVLVRKSAPNLVLLANSTFLSKISHSSMKLTKDNIRGSFNGSDIMREFNGISNCPENFETLFAFHQGLDWTDNLERLVTATSEIEPGDSRFVLDDERRKNILDSVDRAELFVNSAEYQMLLDDLNSRCQACRNEIIVASHIENTNVRGRLIEAMITADGSRASQVVRRTCCCRVAIACI